MASKHHAGRKAKVTIWRNGVLPDQDVLLAMATRTEFAEEIVEALNTRSDPNAELARLRSDRAEILAAFREIKSMGEISGGNSALIRISREWVARLSADSEAGTCLIRCYCQCHSPIASRPGCLHCKPELFADRRDGYCETEAEFASRIKPKGDSEVGKPRPHRNRCNRAAYVRLIEEDIVALNGALSQHSLERRHIEDVLRWSVIQEYGEPKGDSGAEQGEERRG